jgi:hypothetical protein
MAGGGGSCGEGEKIMRRSEVKSFVESSTTLSSRKTRSSVLPSCIGNLRRIELFLLLDLHNGSREHHRYRVFLCEPDVAQCSFRRDPLVLIDFEHRHDECFGLLTHASPQHLRIFYSALLVVLQNGLDR